MLDVGTASNAAYLVDLLTATIVGAPSKHNRQIPRGGEIIWRVIYASKGDAVSELQPSVVGTINRLPSQTRDRKGRPTCIQQRPLPHSRQRGTALFSSGSTCPARAVNL